MELYNYLLPKPRFIKELSAAPQGAAPQGTKIDKSLGAQEYKLYIEDDRVGILGGSKTAIFYAEQTLAQLWELYSGTGLPDLLIHDWPEIETRGYYYDITRGKVPNLKTLKMLADRLAYYKINQLQLYVEHTFAFEGFEEMWENASPLTAKEIRDLDAYCTKRHIELVPSLSTFGHLYELLRTKKYRHLCELENQAEVPFNWPDRMLHHTIDVSNPESIQVIKNLLDQFIPLFKSEKFNICCDETFDLGRGKNKELAEKVGKGRLYVDFLKQIIGHVQGHGKTVMFWGDILLEHPEYISEIPKDAILLNWDYNATPNEEKIRKITEGGLNQYLCPGVWSWNNLVNDIRNGYENISKMAKLALKYNAHGLLITDWGDFGNVNSLATSIPGMIMGASFSWSASQIPTYEESCKVISRLEYGDDTEKLVGEMALFCHIGDENSGVWGTLGFNDYVNLIGEKHVWHNATLFEKSFKEVWEGADKAAENAMIFKATLAGAKRINQEDLGEIEVGVSGYELMLRILAQKIDPKAASKFVTKSEMKRMKKDWLKAFSKVWMRRNKKSELYRIQEFVGRI